MEKSTRSKQGFLMCDNCQIVKPYNPRIASTRGFQVHSEILHKIGRARRSGLLYELPKEKSDAARAADWFMVDAFKREGEKPIRNVALRQFRDQEKESLKNLKRIQSKKYLRKDALELAIQIFDIEFWYKETVKRFGPSIAATAIQGFKVGLSRVDAIGDFDPEAVLVRQTLEEVLAKTRGINDSVLKDLVFNMQKGLDDGAEDLVPFVQRAFKVSRSRAQTIAQTAATPGFEVGQTQAYNDAGIPFKGWLSRRDGLVRTGKFDHLEPDESKQRVKIADPFLVSGESLMFPGDPVGSAGNVINCRCSTEPFFELAKSFIIGLA